MIGRRLAGKPGWDTLSYLQKNGTATIKQLEGALGVTATAVRQQITSLRANGYVVQKLHSHGRGRPRHVYSLSAEGRALFPRHYDELTNTLLDVITASDGPQKVGQLMARMGIRLAEQYARQMEGVSPDQRAHALTELLNAKGILAEVEADDGGIIFREFNCPYFELAREYRAICEMEQGMIAEVLRQQVALVACTLDGHQGCYFRIATHE